MKCCLGRGIHPPQMVRIALIAVFAFCIPACSSEVEPIQKDSAFVVVQRAELQSQPEVITALGVIEPLRSAAVTPQVTGLVAAAYVSDGQDVRKGQKLFEIDSRTARVELEKAQAELAIRLAEHRRLESQAARYDALAASRFVSADELRRHLSEVQISSARVRLARAEVAGAGLEVERTYVKAPFDGQLGKLAVHVGDRAGPDVPSEMAKIHQISPAYVAFSLPTDTFTRLKEVSAIRSLDLSVASHDGRSSERVEFSYVDNELDRGNGMVRVRGTLKNPDHSFLPGQFVNVSISLGRQSLVAVPESAIRAGADGDYVYVVDSDHVARRRDVSVKARSNNIVRVSNGLFSGEAVVVDGQARVSDGARVRVVDALK